jgi:ATP-dependent DNA ligase
VFIKARFFELMLLLRTERLLDGPGWVYAIKFDGYRALAIKSTGKVQSSTRLVWHYPSLNSVLVGRPVIHDGEQKDSA